MPATDSPAVLVARFLQANGYSDVGNSSDFGIDSHKKLTINQTLAALLIEAGLPEDAGTTEPGDLTIEKVLDEKKIFDVSLRFEKAGVVEGGEQGWRVPGMSVNTKSLLARSAHWRGIAPSKSHELSLPTRSNLLHVAIEIIKDFPLDEDRPRFGPFVLASTADRRLHILSSNPSNLGVCHFSSQLNDSPILSFAVIKKRWLVSSSMSGQVILSDLAKGLAVLDERRDHTKYVVQVAVHESDERTWIATAGWDGKVLLYLATEDQDRQSMTLGFPVGSINLPCNPEALLFVQDPSRSGPLLVVSHVDSTNLHYYAPPSITEPTAVVEELELLGKQNLAPHANAWISFSPSALAVCPTDPSIIAVGTSAQPHMKLIVVRLLLPSQKSARPATHAAQMREAVDRANEEASAILSHVSTLAPQSTYSTPQICWRPDGSGVWVNGDDGVVRGVEAATGKVVQSLNEGHEAGNKIRSLWSGWVRDEEWLLSGAFDRKLVLWRSDQEDG